MVMKVKYSRREVLLLKQMFIEHDIDGNGTVTPREIAKALEAHSTILSCYDTFKVMDLNHDGVLTFEEYIKRMYPLATKKEQAQMGQWAFPDKVIKAPVGPKPLNTKQLNELKELYNMYDKNKNGLIERDEFRVLIRNSGFSEDDGDEIFLANDKDHDGVVSFDEFVVLMKDSYTFSDDLS